MLTNAIAFNFLLCLFPLLVVVAALSQRLPMGGRRAGVALLLVLQELIPFEHDSLATAIQGLTRVARGLEALSLLLIVWGSSGVFVPVELALNRAWGGGQRRSFWRARLLAFGITLGCGLLALASVGLTMAAQRHRVEWPRLAGYAAKSCGLLATYAIFFLIYRFVPGARVPTPTAGRAALVAGSAWEAVKYIFIVRLPALNLKAFYGPLAFAVTLILWAYVSSLVLVFGALIVPLGNGRNRRPSR